MMHSYIYHETFRSDSKLWYRINISHWFKQSKGLLVIELQYYEFIEQIKPIITTLLSKFIGLNVRHLDVNLCFTASSLLICSPLFNSYMNVSKSSFNWNQDLALKHSKAYIKTDLKFYWCYFCIFNIFLLKTLVN